MKKENWWLTTPKIIDGKFVCVAIDQWGCEVTSRFTLEELAAHLTKRAPDARKAALKKVSSNKKGSAKPARG